MRHSLDDAVPGAALDGATVVITRPSGTGASLAQAVRAEGGVALLLPGLRLQASGDEHVLATARACELWVFTSPAAVRFAFRAGLQTARRDVAAFAVGEGTSAELVRHGMPALAPHGRADSDSLLALPALFDVRGRRVALFGAPGGRDAIAPALRARGAVVDDVHVYERRPPRLTRRHFDAVENARAPLIMLVSSGAALGNLAALLPPAALARLRRACLVASSARMAELARSHGFGDVSIADSALPRDLLAAAARRLARSPSQDGIAAVVPAAFR